MQIAEKAEITRKALQDIAMETDATTSEAILNAVSACGDASLARLYDYMRAAARHAERPRPLSEILGQTENAGS